MMKKEYDFLYNLLSELYISDSINSDSYGRLLDELKNLKQR